MSLADPQTITVNAVAKIMPKILSAGMSSKFQLADQTFTLEVKHREVVRDKKRRVISQSLFTQRKVVADPLTAVNDFEFLSTSLQTDRPEAGYSSTEHEQQWAGLKTWFDSTMMGKFFGRES
jgi:hypothetical protein